MRKARDGRAVPFSGDKVHPGDDGQLLIAQTILVAGSSTLLDNASTAATVWVQGNSTYGSAQLSIGSITNNGTIRMESIDSTWR